MKPEEKEILTKNLQTLLFSIEEDMSDDTIRNLWEAIDLQFQMYLKDE